MKISKERKQALRRIAAWKGWETRKNNMMDDDERAKKIAINTACRPIYGYGY